MLPVSPNSRMLHLPEGNPVPICCHSPPFPGPHEPPFPSLEEPGLEVSHVWTHTPCGLLCLVPSLSLVGSGSGPGATHVGASLLFAAERRACTWGTPLLYPLACLWMWGCFHLPAALHTCVRVRT